MVSSSRQALACILLIFGAAVYSQAQTSPAKESTASISGKVTVKGKGVPGIIITAQDPVYRGGWATSRYRATTNESGEYRISNLPAGTYRLMPHAMAFTLENEQVTSALIVGDGETIEDINFALVRGAVITGKITDAEGNPLVEEGITLTPVDEKSDYVRMHVGGIHTDDRGVYRAFGLKAGKYKVSAGHSERHLPGYSQHAYKQTFYPSTTDEAKATVIEVSPGSEINDINIVMAGRTSGGFKVTGRIIDGKTGKPIPNLVYGIIHSFGDGSSTSTSGSRTNADGEFRFENVLPGKYSVYIEQQQNFEMRANPLPFEMTDRDITGLEIRTLKGASLSGVVVFEGSGEKPVIKQGGPFHLFAWVENPDNQGNHTASSASIQPDWSFRIGGLRNGIAHISLGSTNRRGDSDYGIVRLERDGVVQSGGINIKEGEDIGGLRLVLRHLNGAIRGQVKIEDGPLPSSARMMLSVVFLDDPSTPRRAYRSEEVDPRGRFHIEALAPGRYEVKVGVFLVGAHHRFIEAKQEVTVSENAASEVVLTVKLKADPDEDDDP